MEAKKPVLGLSVAQLKLLLDTMPPEALIVLDDGKEGAASEPLYFNCVTCVTPVLIEIGAHSLHEDGGDHRQLVLHPDGVSSNGGEIRLAVHLGVW